MRRKTHALPEQTRYHESMRSFLKSITPERWKQWLVIGCGLFGAATGFILGVYTCSELIVLLTTEAERQFMFIAYLYLLVSGVVHAVIGGWFGLHQARLFYGSRWYPLLLVFSALGYLVTLALAILLIYYIVLIFFQVSNL